jgi:hypothetical protein
VARPYGGHEDFQRESEVAGGSDRGFGFVFAVVFLVIGLIPLLSGWAVRWWSLAVAAAFAALAVLAPRALAPLNRLWLKLGLLLHRVVTPVVMGILFYGTVVPTGLVMRALGKDPLRLRHHPGVRSYWILREPPGPPPETMKNQF